MGRASSDAFSRWSRSPGCCGFRRVFWVRRDFVFFFFRYFLFERTWPAASMEPPCLIYLSTSMRTYTYIYRVHVRSINRWSTFSALSAKRWRCDDLPQQTNVATFFFFFLNPPDVFQLFIKSACGWVKIKLSKIGDKENAMFP